VAEANEETDLKITTKTQWKFTRRLFAENRPAIGAYFISREAGVNKLFRGYFNY
jgi:hypothetical protein